MSVQEIDDFRKRAARRESAKEESVQASPWFINLPSEKQLEVAKLIENYVDWNPHTDLRGDHTAGMISFEGHTILWRIKQYDATPPGLLMATPPIYLGLFIIHSAEI